jgi:hypothetical protein
MLNIMILDIKNIIHWHHQPCRIKSISNLIVPQQMYKLEVPCLPLLHCHHFHHFHVTDWSSLIDMVAIVLIVSFAFTKSDNLISGFDFSFLQSYTLNFFFLFLIFLRSFVTFEN